MSVMALRFLAVRLCLRRHALPQSLCQTLLDIRLVI